MFNRVAVSTLALILAGCAASKPTMNAAIEKSESQNVLDIDSNELLIAVRYGVDIKAKGSLKYKCGMSAVAVAKSFSTALLGFDEQESRVLLEGLPLWPISATANLFNAGSNHEQDMAIVREAVDMGWDRGNAYFANCVNEAGEPGTPPSPGVDLKAARGIDETIAHRYTTATNKRSKEYICGRKAVSIAHTLNAMTAGFDYKTTVSELQKISLDAGLARELWYYFSPETQISENWASRIPVQLSWRRADVFYGHCMRAE